MLVVLCNDKLPWVVSLLILLHPHRLRRMRDDGSGSDDADEGDGASSPSDDEMSTCCTYPLSLVTKMGK